MRPTMASRKRGASKKKTRIELPEGAAVEGKADLLIHCGLDNGYNH